MTAAEYNNIRRIIFCTVHDTTKGFSCAYNYLEGYRAKLGPRSYAGLKAELSFYQRYRQEFNLTVAGDMGEHADFAGTFGTQASRFDVTTNITYKNFTDYEQYLGVGPHYKIALLDQNNFEVIDVYDLAFQRCPSCGGFEIPCIVLMGQNYNRHGESQWTNDQLLLNICTGCNEFVERQRYTGSGWSSPQEHFESFDSSDGYDEAIKSTEQHCLEAYRYFRRSVDDHLMAVAQHEYMITEPKGGGYWALDFVFKNQAVARALPQNIEWSHEI